MEKIPTTEPLQERDYLNPGVKAITACLGTGETKGLPEAITGTEFSFVNIDANPEEKLEEGFSGEYVRPHWAYVMSPIDTANKFSVRYANCTGIIVVGTDLETGQNVSFLTHQNPSYFLHDSKKFVEDLHARFSKLKDTCIPGTIDAVLFGGKFANVREVEDPAHPIHKIEQEDYIESIRLASKEIQEYLGFSPTVIVGPKLNPAEDVAVFDTQERRLFLERLGKNEPGFVNNFESKDIDTVAKSFKPGRWGLSAEVLASIKKKREEEML